MILPEIILKNQEKIKTKNNKGKKTKKSRTNSNNGKKSRIRETPTLSTDADSRTDTNLKRLRDLSLTKNLKKI